MNELRRLRSFLVACALFSASALAAQPGTPNSTLADSVTVKALKPEPGAASLYEIAFVPRDTLANDAEIVLTFADACDLAELEIAGSAQINGGLLLAREGQRVTVRRSGVGDAIAPGRRVSFKLGMIGNPADLAANHVVEVIVRTSAQDTADTGQRVEIEF